MLRLFWVVIKTIKVHLHQVTANTESDFHEEKPYVNCMNFVIHVCDWNRLKNRTRLFALSIGVSELEIPIYVFKTAQIHFFYFM